jgi:DNA repair exonuclease SbcCD ATPase subunit
MKRLTTSIVLITTLLLGLSVFAQQQVQQPDQQLNVEDFREPLEQLQQAANDIIDRLLEQENQLSVEREDLEELQERLNEVTDALLEGNEVNGAQVNGDTVAELQNVVNNIFNAVLADLPENDAAQQQQQPDEQQELATEDFREPLEQLQQAANDIIDRLLEQENQLSVEREDLEELQEHLNEIINDMLTGDSVQRESVEGLQEVVNDVFDAVLADLDDNEM